MVPQDIPQLQLAAAAVEALPRTGGGAGLQASAGRRRRGSPPGTYARAVLRRRSVMPVAGQRTGLGVSRQVVLNKAGSAVPLVFPGAARTELESQLQRAVKVSAKGKHVKCKMDLERCLFVLFEVRHLMLEPLEAPCCPF